MDIWELLNMDNKEVADYARSMGDYPDRQAREFAKLVGAFRTIARILSHNGPQEELALFQSASDQVRRIMVKYAAHLAQFRVIQGQRDEEGLLTCWAPRTGGVFDGRPLFRHPTISFHVGGLLDFVHGANREKIMTCDYCGQLKPRKRTDQRFCGQDCRKSFYAGERWRAERQEVTEAADAVAV